MEGYAGRLLSLAYPGYRHNIGGGKPLSPTVPQCNILVPWRVINRRHLTTAQCAKGAESKRRRLSEEELRDSTERAFQDSEKPLETVTLFNYLGQVMPSGYNNWPAVVGNLRMAWTSWAGQTRGYQGSS